MDLMKKFLVSAFSLSLLLFGMISYLCAANEPFARAPDPPPGHHPVIDTNSSSHHGAPASPESHHDQGDKNTQCPHSYHACCQISAVTEIPSLPSFAMDSSPVGLDDFTFQPLGVVNPFYHPPRLSL